MSCGGILLEREFHRQFRRFYMYEHIIHRLKQLGYGQR